jgi:hypothetical protein
MSAVKRFASQFICSQRGRFSGKAGAVGYSVGTAFGRARVTALLE